MAEVLFYHLTESTLEDALPGLLEKSVERGWKAVVQTGTEERRDVLDAHLWTFRDDSFLAHATDREAHSADQPVLLTTAAGNPNARRHPLHRRRRRTAGARRLQAGGVPVRRARPGAGRGRARALEAAEGREPRGHLLAADARAALGAQGVRLGPFSAAAACSCSGLALAVGYPMLATRLPPMPIGTWPVYAPLSGFLHLRRQAQAR